MPQNQLVTELNQLYRQKQRNMNSSPELDRRIFELNLALGLVKKPGDPPDIIKEADYGIEPPDYFRID